MRKFGRSPQRGVAAIEFAAILPVLLLLLALPLFFGRIYWHYTVSQKAVQDGARYLSSIPLSEMRQPNQVGYSVAVARWIVDSELADLNPGKDQIAVTILCDNWICDGLAQPSTVSVGVRMRVYDFILQPSNPLSAGSEGMLLTAVSRMRYVSN